MGDKLKSPDCYTLRVQARLKSNGSWISVGYFPSYISTGKKIEKKFLFFQWEENEYVEDLLRLEKAVDCAQKAMINPDYQDVRIEDSFSIQGESSYRFIWLNGRWHQHY